PGSLAYFASGSVLNDIVRNDVLYVVHDGCRLAYFASGGCQVPDRTLVVNRPGPLHPIAARTTLPSVRCRE
ncbi:MAG: hypothetical protein Q8O07_04445, partial [Chloroflexota bacterium]|nr:hypothetical protein [Chloroflexota bacterium]